jgi:hypothetical protein
MGAWNLFPQNTNVAGFVHREQQALITTYLADATMVIPQGFPVTLMTQGDFWALNSGTGPAYTGQKAFAQFSNGAVIFANASTTPLSSTVTGSTGPVSFSITGSISGDLLTVTSGTGVIPIGATVSGTVSGSGVVANTQISNQISGASGGTGVYAVNVAEQSVPSGSLTVSYMLLSVSGTTGGGPLAVGDVLTATGTALTTGTLITQFGTGTGATGTYYLAPAGQTANASATFTSTNSVETKWYAASSGQTGELIKITSWVGSQG